MDDRTHQPWFQLCQLASVEQDPEKLLALVTEINRLLEGQDTERKEKEKAYDARRKRSWKETPELDAHQTEARQPYVSRESHSDATTKDSEQHAQGSDSSEEPE